MAGASGLGVEIVFREAEDMVRRMFPERQAWLLALQPIPSDQTTDEAPNISKSHLLISSL